MRRVHEIVALGLGVIASLPITWTAAAAGGSNCRVLPGDGDWPSTNDWDQLNRTVDGRLVATIPVGTPCHDPNYDAGACSQLQAAWQLPQTQ